MAGKSFIIEASDVSWTSCSTMVQHLSKILKIVGSNLTAGTRGEKMAGKSFIVEASDVSWTSCSTVVEHLSKILKIVGSNLTAGTRREKWREKVL